MTAIFDGFTPGPVHLAFFLTLCYSELMTVSKKEFADIAGIGKSGVSNLVSRGTIETTSSGDIDLEDPGVIEYLSRRQERQQSKPASTPKPIKLKSAVTKQKASKTLKPPSKLKTKPAPQESDGMTVDEFEELSNPKTPLDINELVRKNGHTTIEALARIRNREVDTRLKLIKTAEHEGQLILKKPLGDFVLMYMENLNKALLASSFGYVDSIIAMVQAQGTGARGEIAELISDAISELIRRAKRDSKRYLKGLRSGTG